MNTTESINYIINSNPSLFDLRFKDYVNGKVVLTEPSKYAIEDATKDLELFNKRQLAILERDEISIGDWVLRKDGKTERITVDSWSDCIQVGGTFGGSFYISKNGYCSYSGSCGDVISKTNLIKTDEYKEGSCWIFSQDWTGGGRGVHYILKFKVWKEV